MMTNQVTETSPRRAALIAGVGYLFLFFLAIYANFFVREGLVDPDNAAATFTNIADSEMLFRAALIAFLIIFVLDIAIAWALYVLFKTVSQQLSLVTAWFRVVYTVFLGVALIFFFGVLQIIDGADFLNSFDQGQLDAQVAMLLEAFNYAWLIGLASFGVHLVLIGYLILSSKIASRALGIVLAVAGVAYMADTVFYTILPNYSEYENLFLAMVAVPSVIGELAFTIWLLARAGKPQVPSSALESDAGVEAEAASAGEKQQSLIDA
jgi:hypothetical protein